MLKRIEAILFLFFIVLAVLLWLYFSQDENAAVAYVDRRAILEKDIQSELLKRGIPSEDRKKVIYRYQALATVMDDMALRTEAYRLHVSVKELMVTFEAVATLPLPPGSPKGPGEAEFRREWEFLARRKYLTELKERYAAVIHPRFFSFD